MANNDPIFTGGSRPLREAIEQAEEAERNGTLTVPTLALTILAASAAETARVTDICIEAQKAEKELWRRRALRAEGALLDVQTLQAALSDPFYARRLLKLIGAPVAKYVPEADEWGDGRP